MSAGRLSTLTLTLMRRAALPCALAVGLIGLLAIAPQTAQAAAPSSSVTPSATPSVGASARPTQTTRYPLNASSFSLTVTPTRLVLGPDTATDQHMQVINRGQDPVRVEVQKRNFVPSADGTLSFQQTAPFSASNWLTVSPLSFTVAPGATQIIDVKVRVGKDPEPGDHQVALVFLVPAGKTTANISINRGIATPVYVTVAGATSEMTDLGPLTARHFVMRGPVTIATSLRNVGTVHRDFRGTTPLMLRAAGESSRFPDFTILRGSVRDITTTWHPPFLCVCHPTVSLTNADGTTQTSTVRIIVFPLYLLVFLLAGAALVFGGVRWRRHNFRTAVAAATATALAATAATDSDAGESPQPAAPSQPPAKASEPTPAANTFSDAPAADAEAVTEGTEPALGPVDPDAVDPGDDRA